MKPVANLAAAFEAKYDLESHRNKWALRRSENNRDRSLAKAAAEKATISDEPGARKSFAMARRSEVEARNRLLSDDWTELSSIFEDSLEVETGLDLDNVRNTMMVGTYKPKFLAVSEPRPKWEDYNPPSNRLADLIPLLRDSRQRLRDAAVEQYRSDLVKWREAEEDRVRQIEESEAMYAEWLTREKGRTTREQLELDRFIGLINGGDSDAILSFFTMVLNSMVWPPDFPSRFELRLDGSSSLLALDYYLPDIHVIPAKECNYDKKADAFDHVLPSDEAAGELYEQIMCQSALRLLRELFGADQFEAIQTVALNCRVDTINPATGQPNSPCLISVRTTAAEFGTLRMSHVEPIPCLEGLGAVISPDCQELEPVHPIFDLRQIDSRFGLGPEILLATDSRKNLLDFSPQDYAALIGNLIKKMGLEPSKPTLTKDNTVHVAAHDARAVLGGTILIRASQDNEPVTVSAMRELYRSVQSQGALKGVMITTAGFGRACYEFANGKPLELISGPNLLSILSEHLPDRKVRIVGVSNTPKGELTKLPLQ